MENETEQKPEFFAEPTWAIVELMGHQTIAGQITEVNVAGCPMLRIDVPALPATTEYEAVGAYTRFIGAKALYSITPTNKTSALHAVTQLRARPIVPYAIPVRAIASYHDEDEAAPF